MSEFLRTVELKENCVRILDQTKLPGKIEYEELFDIESVWRAIKRLEVRGAPAIGVAAAFGMYIAVKNIYTDDISEFYQKFCEYKSYLSTSRPTAVNLFWALKRMEYVVLKNSDKSVEEVRKLLLDESIKIQQEDEKANRKIGEYGLKLIKPGYGILTHCNAGSLATSKWGTATAPIYMGKEKGYNLKVFCDETRPLLQGARLTAFELSQSGVDTTLICDNMASYIMQKGWIQAVFVGCDRVAANGDTANKIGTSGVAVLANYYNIPFYVCAPTSTIDLECPSGAHIEIEERDPGEVTDMWYEKRMAPEEIKVCNPAFDVTPAELITAIITEKGIAYPKYEDSLQNIIRRK